MIAAGGLFYVVLHIWLHVRRSGTPIRLMSRSSVSFPSLPVPPSPFLMFGGCPIPMFRTDSEKVANNAFKAADACQCTSSCS
jgi:hypothetical protein